MRYFSRNGIFRSFWAVQRWLVSRQPTCRQFFPVRAEIFESFRHRYPVAAHRSGCQEHDRRPDHDVSGMAPPSRMMLAQRSRIAANMSNVAAPICKKICRPWRTILPAV